MDQGCISRRRFMQWIAMAAGASTLPAARGWAQPPEGDPKWNIVFVVADDIGLHLGCYGDPQANTPHLDRFARENVLFRNAFVTSPTCSPSRAAILTGRYAHQNGQIGLSHTGFRMNDGERTIPAMLNQAGYYTGILGKIHVKPEEAFGFDFKYGGFDYFVDGEKTTFVEEPVSIIDRHWDQRHEAQIPVMQVPREVGAHTGRFLDEAGDQPFFLMVNLPDPHPPYRHQVAGVPEEPKRPRDVEQIDFVPPDQPFHPNAVAGYYNGCTRLDACFEQVMRQLRQRDLERNTLVVFLSDHGPNFGHRGKGTLYEAGLHVPMIARFPDQTGPLEVDEMVSALDLMPTVLDAAGVSRESQWEGQSLRRLFDGRWRDRDVVFGEANYHVPETFIPVRSIREQRYKLIHNPFAPVYAERLANWGVLDELDDDAHWHNRNYHAYAQRPEFELYDLQEDPYELNNLAQDPEHAQTRERLLQRLQDWQRESGDFLIEARELHDKRREGLRLLEAVFDEAAAAP